MGAAVTWALEPEKPLVMAQLNPWIRIVLRVAAIILSAGRFRARFANDSFDVTMTDTFWVQKVREAWSERSIHASRQILLLDGPGMVQLQALGRTCMLKTQGLGNSRQWSGQNLWGAQVDKMWCPGAAFGPYFLQAGAGGGSATTRTVRKNREGMRHPRANSAPKRVGQPRENATFSRRAPSRARTRSWRAASRARTRVPGKDAVCWARRSAV